MYVGVGLVFLLVAGLEASLMRLQLAAPENTMLSPQVFNRLFTMHGTTMVFFVGIPIVFGFANYLVPLMIGTRDLAFPRLNAFGFWLLLFSGLSSPSYLAGDGCTGPARRPMLAGSPMHR
jgi:cytochrome c oxidase subunit 1